MSKVVSPVGAVESVEGLGGDAESVRNSQADAALADVEGEDTAMRRGHVVGFRHTEIIGPHLTWLMAEKKVANIEEADEAGREAPERAEAARIAPHVIEASTDEAVTIVAADGETILLPLQSGSNNAQKVIALLAICAFCYFGRPVLVPLACALLLAFILEPIVRGFEWMRLPRAAAALVAMLLLSAAIWGLSYVSYKRAAEFVQDLPKYSEKLRKSVGKFREESQKLEKAKQAVAPDQPDEKNAVKVKTVNPAWEGLTSTAGTLTEMALAFSFVPFLAYFMLTWSHHMRAAAVKMFKPEDRKNANRALLRIAEMIKGFIIGNLMVGIAMGALNSAVFWKIGVPNFFIVGFISGFLSLVPYLGVPLAALPPLMVSIGALSGAKMGIILATVLFTHLFTLNVVYPKLLGARLQLNPLVVTASLLIWGFLWGAMGLILAVPITAAVKIICDHVEPWRGLGELMGEGVKE